MVGVSEFSTVFSAASDVVEPRMCNLAVGQVGSLIHFLTESRPVEWPVFSRNARNRAQRKRYSSDCQVIHYVVQSSDWEELATGHIAPHPVDMKVHLFDLPETAYEHALEAQYHLHEQVRLQVIDAALMILTHPNTVTLGRHADPSHIIDTHALEQRGWAIHQVDRGGDITWHGPGQLVAYPILPLDRSGLSVRALICLLSNALRATLADHGITAHWEDETPGVWVDQDKIAAIGLRIARRVTRHGISLNVSPDLSAYEMIVPCGLHTRGVTSMQHVLETELSMQNVRNTLTNALVKELPFSSVERFANLPDISVATV